MTTPELNYPDELPVSAHRADILAALRGNPAVVVCGDTGSGKTTQLPKMALELGRAARGRRIACTQPRRLAAVSMAERVAAELKVEVGGLVGYRHRFARKVSSETRVEFMTDGVLLAETRFDPLLRAYDTVIVDEAHERSLNVDFLLGILKRILARRRDLKVIVSSATLDTDRFAAFFGAPAVLVPGRLFPVTVEYRPTPDGEEADLPRDVAAAVAELPPRDDVLVFLPGERDIRETAEHLRGARGAADDVIPLLASLPADEQRRAFLPSPRRRIILATNVAETSVTIPGIRAVIDSGLARISRYVHRTQVQRLQVEPVSQASARQRAGRCGRLGPGTCIRLYSEEDYLARDAFTPPEVLRSSLAGVILTMLDLRLGDIGEFPFIDPPRPAAIHEGLKELLELGAIRRAEDGGPELTETGRKLAKIPVEPRLARMLLAASHNAVLPSAIPLVAAMACDDPRRRPIDERERADRAHARFRTPGSDFLGTLKLWRWWCDETKGLSQAKARKLCKAAYLSFPKMREWRELALQLESLSKRLGLDVTGDNGGDDMLHRSLLAGLLGRIGRYDEETRDYRGAHGLRFAIHPGSVLAKAAKKDKRQTTAGKGDRSQDAKCQAPVWIMAGELVDTARLFARDAAVIDPRWLEPVAGPICRHSYHSPEWDPSAGFVRATEQVTLYGLVIVPARRCDYSRIDPAFAREVFIRRGLVGGEFPRPSPPIRENLALIDALRKRAEKSRRPELFDTARLEAFFADVVPPDVASADALRKWLRTASPQDLDRFRMKRDDWWPRGKLTDRDFPDSLRIAGVTIALDYRHAPDDPETDGVTATVRKSNAGILRLWRHDWLVPGLLPEKLTWMLGTLPTALRRVLSPLEESVTVLLSVLTPDGSSLEDAVRRAVLERYGYRIPEDAWTKHRLPPHLNMRFRVRDDETGRTLAVSRDADEALAKAGVADTAHVPRSASASAPAIATTWTFGDIPAEQTDTNAGWATRHFPALHDEGTGVTHRLYADRETAEIDHAAGVTRLLLVNLEKTSAVPFRRRQLPLDAALYLKEIDYDDKRVATDILTGAIAEALVRNRPPVRSREEFQRRILEDRSPLVLLQKEIAGILAESAATATRVYSLLEQGDYPEETSDSVSSQIGWLLYRGFPRLVPVTTLRHYRRYLKGVLLRLERARLSPGGDRTKEARFAPYWERYLEAVKPENRGKYSPTALNEYRWMLEEYRVSVFAQELHTPEPVSPKRLDARWESAIRR